MPNNFDGDGGKIELVTFPVYIVCDRIIEIRTHIHKEDE